MKLIPVRVTLAKLPAPAYSQPISPNPMITIIKAIFLLLPLILLSTYSLASNTTIHLIGADVPPFSMQVQNKIQGINMQLAILAAEQMDLEYKAELLPWKRALQQARQYSNTVLVGLARTKEREALFNWITPVFQSRIGFLSLASKPEEHLNYRAKTCVHYNTPMEVWLKQAGETDFISVSNEHRCLTLLAEGAVRQWFSEVHLAQYLTKQAAGSGIVLQEQQIVLRPALYIATAKHNQHIDIQAWRKTLQALIKQGELKKLLHQYLGPEFQQHLP